MLVLIAGCSHHPSFREYNASNPLDAYDELVRRHQAVNGFTASAGFKLELPAKSISFNGKIKYRFETGWTIALSGPLGVNLAVLSINDTDYNLFLTQSGHVASGHLSDSLKIYEMGIFLPSVEMLIKSLFPTVDIHKDENWQIDPLGNRLDGNLILNRKYKGRNQRIDLAVLYKPLRVKKETHRSDGKMVYYRKLTYRSDSDNIPNTITIYTGDLKLLISYHSLQLDYYSPLDSRNRQDKS